jgi:hypothetical protein
MFSCQRMITLAGKPARLPRVWNMIFVLAVSCWPSNEAIQNIRGTRNASLASDHYNVVVDVVFKCLRQRSNRLEICFPAVFYMYVFSW